MKKLVKKSIDTLSISKTSKGFTLLELLIVVLIIGILAGIALPQYKYVVMKSKFHTIFNLTNAIQQSEQRYYLLYNTYSADLGSLDIDMPLNAKINNEGTVYSYGAWKCYTACGGRCGGCSLYDKGAKVIYWFELAWNSRRCVINPSNYEIGNRICKDITKKTSPYVINPDDDAHYLF